MTERLYYADSYCTRFSASVTEQCTWEGRPATVLDRTAFYPTSGGQPADWGTLGGVAVLDVVVREKDGAIVHVLSEPPLPASGRGWGRGEVEGVIGWPRRFDHMQQHTGQHVLSAAFEQLLDADTVGFHLGAETCTIDVDVARLELAAVVPVEELANQVVWGDCPVDVRFVDSDELATLPLRRPPAVEGAVRIVDIAAPSTMDAPSACTDAPSACTDAPSACTDAPSACTDAPSASGHSFDVNPCGGTHVARTGEIGLIKIVHLDYRGDETRVEFLCGKRALDDYRSRNEMVSRLANMLTVGYWELDQAVERLQAEGKQLRKGLRQARKRLLEVEASELAETAVPLTHERGSYRVVCKVWEQTGESPEELRALAHELTQRPDVTAFLVSVGVERTHLIFARNLDAEVDLDVATLLRDACAQLGGKGGGRPHFAQGSAPVTDAARVRTALADLLSPLGVAIS